MDFAEKSPEGIADVLVLFMENLKCEKCALPLTAYPIYVSLQGGASLCGRCPLPNPSEYLRDKPFEETIRTLQFQCRYKKFGCSKLCLPALMVAHERRCPHRIIKCPKWASLDCVWKGSMIDLSWHFESDHPRAILADKKYELDFTKNVSDIYLIHIENNIFLLRLQINKFNKIYNCSLEHMPNKYSSPFYKYSVTIETDNPRNFRDYSPRHTDSELLEVRCISRAELEEHLPNANKFRAHFKINKSDVDVKLYDYPNDVTEEMKNMAIDWAKLEGLKCPSCYGYLVNPIQQCRNNHILCLKCGEHSKCNLCQMELEPIKNAVLVGLIDTLKYPCAYRDEGCMVILQSIYIREHESKCRFAYIECPVSEEQKCEVRCRLYETNRHIRFNHPNAMLPDKTVELDLQHNPVPFKRHFLMIYDAMVFKLIFKHEKEALMWSTVIVGSSSDAKKYNFEIEVIDKSGRDIGIVFRAGCTSIFENKTCFTVPGKYVFFSYDLISVFMEEKKLKFHVKILSTENYYAELK